MNFDSKNNDIPVVVIATGVMNAGGTESLIMESLRHASGRIKYIMLIHNDGQIKKGVFDDEIRGLGIQMECIGSVGSLGVKGYISAFREFVEHVGHIDIIHSHLNASGGIISLAAKKAGINHRICHCHADIHYVGGVMKRLKSEVSLAALKILIDLYATDRWACSEAAWKRLYFPWHSHVVIDNMIDTRRYLASSDKREAAKEKFGLSRKFIVGTVGRVAPIKNYECVLNAIAGTDADFVCFGRFDINNSYCKSLDTLAHELGIADRVHWMGNSNNVSDDIHCIDLFVMPSFTEGFGMAAIEAQAASIPSLLSTGVPTGLDVGLGLTKFLSPDDENAWREAINVFQTSAILPDVDVLKAFSDNKFDSVSAVKDIENRYISMIQ